MRAMSPLVDIFVLVVPFGENVSLISHISSALLTGKEYFVHRKQNALVTDEKIQQTNHSKKLSTLWQSTEENETFSTFLDLPWLKSSLCGKCLTTSVENDQYVWYSSAITNEEHQYTRPEYHTLTVAIHFTDFESGRFLDMCHQIVSKLARGLSLEESRCHYVSHQSSLTWDKRELESILTSFLACLVYDLPGKIVLNKYLPIKIKPSTREPLSWKEYTLCFYTTEENKLLHWFSFPYNDIILLLFRKWNPMLCLQDIIEQYIPNEEIMLEMLVDELKGYAIADYIRPLTENHRFHIGKASNVEQLCHSIEELIFSLHLGLDTMEESYAVIEALSRGLTIRQVLDLFRTQKEIVILRYIALLENMQIIQRMVD